MYQTLPLSDSDVVALRAALTHSQFAPLLQLVPGLQLALEHPQSCFDIDLAEVRYAISDVCAHTNSPEEWDDLINVVNTASGVRKEFFQAVEKSERSRATPELEFFILVEERIGSNDGPSFGKHVYIDFDAACQALQTYAHAQFPDLDDDVQLIEHVKPEHRACWVSLESKHHEVRWQCYLQKFTLPALSSANKGDAA